MKKLVFLFMLCTVNLFAQKDSLPVPEIFFKDWDKDYLPWSKFGNGAELVAKFRVNDKLSDTCNGNITCKVIAFDMVSLIEGITNGMRINSGNFDKDALDLFYKAEHRSMIDFYNFRIQYSNGIVKDIPGKKFMKISDDFESYAKYALKNALPGDDFGTSKTDIRIQIIGNPTPKEMDHVNKLVNDLDSLLGNVKIKFVNYAPTIVLKFFHEKDSSYWNSNTSSNTITHNYPFFPKVRNVESYNWTRNFSLNEFMTINGIIQGLADFNGCYFFYYDTNNPKEDTLFLNSHQRQLIKMLYSSKGQVELKKIMGVHSVEIADNTLLILVLSFLLFIAFSELNSRYHFLNVLQFIKIQWLRKMMVSILIVQISIVILCIYQFKETTFTLKTFTHYEIYFSLLACLVTAFIAGIDLINQKIKVFGFTLFVDLFLITLAFLLSYQILFLTVVPELLKPGMIQTQWLYIPLLVIAYRFYLKYDQKKLAGIIREKELEIAKQKEVVLKSEFLSMQSRINPHFLYNALNSIASLAHSSAEKTEEMTLSLAKLFRYNLNKPGEMYSTVAQEIEMVRIYLDVEMVRFSDRMKYAVEVDKEIENMTIPVFLLQPLVENAIKHGISKLTEKGLIKLKIFVENNGLIISVYDNGPEFPSDIKANYGLQSIYDKLSLIYKDNFSIHFINIPEKQVMIKIKIKIH